MPEVCEKCYNEYVAEFRKRCKDKTIHPMKEGFVFTCKVPLKYMDGETEMIKIWNHDTKQFDHYIASEYYKTHK